MKLPRVLIAAPTSRDKDYCFTEWLSNVRRIDYPHDLFLVDNSKDNQYQYKLLREGIQTDRVEPKGSPIHYVTQCQNIIREKVLKEDYDYLLMLETDVMIEPDLLGYMITYRQPVMNVSYFINEFHEAQICLQGITWAERSARQLKMHIDEAFNLYKGAPVKIGHHKTTDNQLCAAGIGCTLIKKEVLQNIKFRVDEQKNKIAFSDSYFHLDVTSQGYANYLLTDRFLHHHRTGWDSHLIKLMNK